MRYKIDTMDLYTVAVNKTVMENCAFISMTFDEVIDGVRLKQAIKNAFRYHPLFGCKLVKDKEYFLETNNKEFEVLNVKEEDRPKIFGHCSNDFLFQFSYYEKTVAFEWCHVVSDGKGAMAFLCSVYSFYFGIEQEPVPKEFPMNRLYNEYYDKNAKPFAYKEVGPGFRPSDLPVIKRGYKCKIHTVILSTPDIIRISKKADASPVALLVPLFSQAIRKNLPADAKRKDVTCGIVIDIRKPLNRQTMHNAIINKVVTYNDKIDKFDLDTICTMYRSILDLACLEDNIKYRITKDSNDIRLFMALKHFGLNKITARILKGSMNNIACTYLGKMDWNEELQKHIKFVDFRSWPDVAEGVFAAIGFGNNIIINVAENYANRNIVPDFVNCCQKLGIKTEYRTPFIFEQANARFK